VTIRTAGIVCTGVLALAGAGGVLADNGKEKIKFNAADQAAARTALLRSSDLGGTGWQGGRIKPDLSSLTCPDYHPKQSDLVLTGAAESYFRRGTAKADVQGVDVEVQVLETARMVALDWRRAVLAPGLLPCLRRSLVSSLGSQAKLISFKRIAFPRLATYSRAYRAAINASASGQSERLFTDVIFVGRGRSEVTLTIDGLTKTAISAADGRLARLVLKRFRV